MATREADARKAVENIRRELEKSKGTHIWQDYVNALRLVSQVVFTRSSGFVLELIQNAEDAGQGLAGLGEVSITVNKNRLKFVHNGAPFEKSNLQAICGIRSSKKPERGTLGYLGIGFKSVFKVADCAETYSSGFRFKFDRDHQEWANQAAHTPWHVIPIWIERHMVNILHKVGIKSSSLNDVYKALTTREGLSAWWTTDTQGESKVGGVLQFRFGARLVPSPFDGSVAA
jgi:hypothetical protein